MERSGLSFFFGISKNIWNILDYSWNMRAGSGGFHL